MRKTLSFVLALVLLLAGSVTVFASEATVPGDVKGTRYEAAVKMLMEKKLVSGYEDGSYRPGEPIVRAEVCAILVNAVNPSDEERKAAPAVFKDMQGYEWAEDTVNFAAEKQVVSGYGAGLFKPGNDVTYNEMATMLVKALGYTDKNLMGNYPDSFVSKAKELGILKEIDITGKGETAATRGDVALMTAAVADQLIEKYQKEQPETPEKPSTPSTTSGAAVPSDNDKFAAYGGAFGMINDVSRVVGAGGSKVDQIEFFMNGQTYSLNTAEENMVKSVAYDGSLYYLKFNPNSEVKGVYADPSQGKPGHYAVLAGKSGWADVDGRDGVEITLSGGGTVNVMRDAVFYRAKCDGDSVDEYESGSLSDIAKGAKVRAYDVSDDTSAVADVIVYITPEDAASMK